MDCQRIEAILDRHRTGALSAAERSEIDVHLETCPRCADAWLCHETLAADRPDAPRAELFGTIVASLFDDTGTAARADGRRLRSRFGVAASAIAIAGLAGWLLYGSDGVAPDNGGVDIAATESVAAPGPYLSVLAAPADAIGEFIAGRDYDLVRNPSPQLANGSQVQICEFFMFECIFCFNFESSLTAWEQTLPADVSLERVPALFNPQARLHAQAFYAAEALGAGNLQMKFYEEIHVLGNRLDSMTEIKGFFERNGIAAEAVDQAFASAAVDASMRRAEQLNTLYAVSATPSLGVNGRYLTNPGLTGSNEKMLAVIDAVISAESGDRCAAGGGSSCPLE